MITGFNTDIKHGGVTYHVQTEDKGLETPLILSLVYVGGAIIASKRSLYNDLIEVGFDEQVLTERLQRQHKLICAAIKAGRVEELKKMGSARDDAAARGQRTPPTEEPAVLVGNDQFQEEYHTGSLVNQAPVPVTAELVAPTEEAPVEATESPAAEQIEEVPAEVLQPEEIHLTILDDEGDFRAGQLATIKIRVARGKGGAVPVDDAAVTIKVLGTTFRPLILSTKTGADGVAIVRALLPRFTSGRAALILRASVGEDYAELRRIIHQA